MRDGKLTKLWLPQYRTPFRWLSPESHTCKAVNTDNDSNNGDYNDSLLLEELKADGDSEEDGNKGQEERNIQQGGGRVPKNLKYFPGGYWCINNDNDNNKYMISVVHNTGI